MQVNAEQIMISLNVAIQNGLDERATYLDTSFKEITDLIKHKKINIVLKFVLASTLFPDRIHLP